MLPEIPRSYAANSADSNLNRVLIGQFCSIFSHPWSIIQKRSGESTWSTETRYPINAANLWHCWTDENTIVGVRFGAATRYALLDIDRESLYHPLNDPAALPRIKQALESIGIYRTVLVRSSDSGGIHLYIPFSESLPTFDVGQSLSHALTSASLSIAPGTLEVFPNAKRYRADQPSNYNGHRLPLQIGSFLLNNDCQPITADITFFLEVMELASGGNDNTEIVNSFVIAKEHARKANFTKAGEPKGYRGKLWKIDCERVIELGWTGYHQTNQILGVIAQYGRVFKGLGDQALERFVVETAIACPGYAEFCRHQRDIEQRCRDWAHSAQRAYTPYVGDRSGNMWGEQKERRANRHNDDQAESALERIKNAIAQLGDRFFTSIREKVAAIVQLARCSLRSLYKHRDLWEGVGNSQNQLLESNSAIEPKAVENDSESLETVQAGLLPPKCDYEGVGPKIFLKRSIEIHSETQIRSLPRPGRADSSDRNPLKPP